jgi:hypothetical protein
MDLIYKQVARMLKKPENVVKKVLEVKTQHPKKNYEALAKKVSKELGSELDETETREIIEKARELIKE